MIIYWKYTYGYAYGSNKEVHHYEIYERDTKTKKERCIFSTEYDNAEFIWKNWVSDNIKTERFMTNDDFIHCNIARISKNDAFLEMI